MLTKRSQEKELMDLGPDYYTKKEYEQCLKTIFKISKLTGTFAQTVKLLKDIPKNATLIDVGCGGGLFLLNLSKYFPEMNLMGTDISKEAISVAQSELARWKKNNQNIKVNFELQIENELDFSPNSKDVILLTLVCHHLDDEELIIFLKKVVESVRIGVIINELQRSIIAYWFFKLISRLFFPNRLIRYDGLISIQRGFTRKELHFLLQQANIADYKIKWSFPFRWSIRIRKNK